MPQESHQKFVFQAGTWGILLLEAQSGSNQGDQQLPLPPDDQCREERPHTPSAGKVGECTFIITALFLFAWIINGCTHKISNMHLSYIGILVCPAKWYKQEHYTGWPKNNGTAYFR